MTAPRVLAAACVLACSGALACRGGRGGLDDASAALQRHRAPFLALDRWVRRAIRGADVLHDERALSEMLFARVRRERSLVAAWVDQEGEPPVTAAHPPATPQPSMSAALRMRDAELGELGVRPSAPCPERKADVKGPASPARCVLIARTAPGPRGALRVTAAFDDSGTSPP